MRFMAISNPPNILVFENIDTDIKSESGRGLENFAKVFGNALWKEIYSRRKSKLKDELLCTKSLSKIKIKQLKSLSNFYSNYIIN